jgi:4-carboxymuconolactone decarboxylase
MATGKADSDRYEQGMKVRRAVLGDDYVDRAAAATTEFNHEFQSYITRNAWGEIWTRPGLSRHTRSLLTLAMMINGVTRDEIKEVLLQSAVYCGVPAANTAFHIAAEVFSEMDKKTKSSSSKRKRP